MTTSLETLALERDHAQAQTERWIRRMTLLEARLEKIRELLVGDPRTEAPAEELPGAILTLLREAHRLAPPPFLPMQEWTQEAKSAAADFYQIVHEAFPALISRAGAQRDVYNDGFFEALRESGLTEDQKEVLRAPKQPLTEEAIAYGREVVAPRIALTMLRNNLKRLILETRTQERGATTQELIALLEADDEDRTEPSR